MKCLIVKDAATKIPADLSADEVEAKRMQGFHVEVEEDPAAEPEPEVPPLAAKKAAKKG